MAVVFKLYIVRHGETELNKELRFYGITDVNVNDHGRLQAKKAGISLKDVPFSRAFSSDLKRASITCELIVKENSNENLKVTQDKLIRERNLGKLENVVYMDAEKTMYEEDGPDASWLTYVPEGGESISDAQANMIKFFKNLCTSVYEKSTSKDLCDPNEVDLSKAAPVETILMVGHGLTLNTLFYYFVRTVKAEDLVEHKALFDVSPNTGISEFNVLYSPGSLKMKCLRHRDVDHLKA